VYPDHKPRLVRPDPPWPHVLRVVVGAVGVAAGLALVRMASMNTDVRASPTLEHVIRVLIFVPVIESPRGYCTGSNDLTASTRGRSSGTRTCRGPSPRSGGGTTTGSTIGSTATCFKRPAAAERRSGACCWCACSAASSTRRRSHWRRRG
jgi:hypothetical protein